MKQKKNVTQKEVDAFIESVDKDKDGKINKE